MCTPEPKWTRLARMRVGKINKLDFKIFALRTEASNLEIERDRLLNELRVELANMDTAGEPRQPWAEHFKHCVLS